MINSYILTMDFLNFDIIILADKRKAIFLDGRFYFSNSWNYTTQDALANKDIYDVEKVFRVRYYKGDAFRFLCSFAEKSLDFDIIYEKQKTCPCCGQIFSEKNNGKSK